MITGRKAAGSSAVMISACLTVLFAPAAAHAQKGKEVQSQPPVVDAPKDQIVLMHDGLPMNPQGFGRLIFSPDGMRLAAVGREEVRLHDRRTGKTIILPCRNTLCDPRDWPKNVTGLPTVLFSADGKRLFTGGSNRVEVWDTTTGQALAKFEASRPVNDFGLAVDPAGKWVALLTWSDVHNYVVEFWDVALRKRLWSRGSPHKTPAPYAFQASTDGQVITFCASGSVIAFDVGNMAEPVVIKDLDGRRIHFDPTGANWHVHTTTGFVSYRWRGFGQRPILEAAWQPERFATPQAITTNGKSLIAVNGERNQVQLIEVGTGRLRARLDGQLINSPTPDGKLVAVYAIEAGQVLVHDVDKGRIHRTLSATALPDFRDRGSVAVAISPSGDAVAFAVNGKVRLESLTGIAAPVGGEQAGIGRVLNLPLIQGRPAQVWRVVVSPSGRYIAALGTDPTPTTIWDLQQGKELLRLADPMAAGRSLAEVNGGFFPADEKGFVALGRLAMPNGNTGLGLVHYDLGSGRTRLIMPPKVAPTLVSAADGSAALIRFWDDKSGRLLFGEWAKQAPPKVVLDGLDFHDRFTARAVSPNGKLAVIQYSRGVPPADEVRFDFWDPATGKMRPAGTVRNGRAPQFFAGGRFLALETNNKLSIIEVESGMIDRDLDHPKQMHSGGMTGYALSPAGEHLLSHGGNGEAFLRDTKTGALLQRLEGHKGTVTGGAFSPDGRRIVTVGEDLTIRMWTVPNP